LLVGRLELLKLGRAREERQAEARAGPPLQRCAPAGRCTVC